MFGRKWNRFLHQTLMVCRQLCQRNGRNEGKNVSHRSTTMYLKMSIYQPVVYILITAIVQMLVNLLHSLSRKGTVSRIIVHDKQQQYSNTITFNTIFSTMLLYCCWKI